MSVWDNVIGQPEAVEALRSAAEGRSSIAHAWLITGPPGSGRSVAARALAAALLCDTAGCGQCQSCTTVMSGAHPDVENVTTEGMTIDIASVRQLVGLAQRHPSLGKYRVIVLEDADRMVERTWNVLLKALEEPPPSTVWILSAPGADDLLPTVRSRCRLVRLRVPDPNIVAQHLIDVDGVAPEQAHIFARAAQSHVGVARRMAHDPQTRARRDTVISLALGMSSVSGALAQAEKLLKTAEQEAESLLTDRDARERAELLRALGVEAGKTVPPALRTQVKRLEDQQKKRVTRTQADVLDRALIDLQSIYRDALVVQLGADVEMINVDVKDDITELANRLQPAHTLRALDAVSQARQRVAGPIMLNRQLALEAMAMSLLGARD